MTYSIVSSLSDQRKGGLILGPRLWRLVSPSQLQEKPESNFVCIKSQFSCLANEVHNRPYCYSQGLAMGACSGFTHLSKLRRLRKEGSS